MGLSTSTVTDFRFSHPLKAKNPIHSTEAGILIDSRFRQPLKAYLPIAFNPSGSESFES